MCMKKLIIILFVLCSTWAFSQKYTFNKMNIGKDESNADQAVNGALSYVYLFNDFAIAGGNSRSLLYRSESWSDLNVGSYTSDFGNSECNGLLVHGFQQNNGDVYALNFAIDSNAFYRWDNVNNNWEFAGVMPSDFSSLSTFVYDETHTLLFGTNRNTNSLEIWQYNNSTFSLKHTYPDFRAKEVWVKDPNHIYFIGGNISTQSNCSLLLYDGLSTISTLYSFNTSCGHINAVASQDNDNLYFLSELGNVYVWNFDDANMSSVYNALPAESGLQEQSIFVMSNNELIVCGKGGIAEININSGAKTNLIETDTNFSFNSCTYQNGHAFFVSSNGIILEMQVPNAIHSVEAQIATMKVFPIPSSNIITVEMNTKHNHSVDAEIYNCYGQIVRITKLTGPSTQLNIDDLTPGSYFIRVIDPQNEGLLGNVKFVKN